MLRVTGCGELGQGRGVPGYGGLVGRKRNESLQGLAVNISSNNLKFFNNLKLK